MVLGVCTFTENVL